MEKQQLVDFYYKIREEAKKNNIRVIFSNNFINRIIHAKQSELEFFTKELLKVSKEVENKNTQLIEM